MTEPLRYAIRFTVNRKTWHIHWHDNWLSWREAGDLERAMQHADLQAMLLSEFDACRDRLSPKSALITGGLNGCWVYCPADVAPRVVRLLAEATGVEPQPMQRHRRGRLGCSAPSPAAPRRGRDCQSASVDWHWLSGPSW